MRQALIFEDLSKYFPPLYTGWRAMLHPLARPTFRALEGVNLALEAGRAMAVIGANGAGKSTLLRIAATLLVPTRGRAQVAGLDVEREAARVRRSIGYHTGSEGGFYARMTARQNLHLFAVLNNLQPADAARSVARLAELLALGPVLDRQVRTLSTGMVQRLGLARALLHQPPVLLLDEPTRSLDPLAAAEFRSFLRREVVEGGGATVLLTTHTLAEAEAVADRVALLHDGRLVACDTPAALRAATGATTLEQAVAQLTARAAERAP